MLTRIKIENFKKLGSADIELGDVVVLIGPNNSGKTSALQALLLWSAGVNEWFKQRKSGTPGKRPGITMSRLGLTQIPLRDAKHLWRDLHVVDVTKANGESKTRYIFLNVTVFGENEEGRWQCGLEFYYANPESFYCRPIRIINDNNDQVERMAVPDAAREIEVALLPPLSGLSPEEPELQLGRISVLLGEGRSGEVLRNLCLRVWEKNKQSWGRIKDAMREMFGIHMGDPKRDAFRGIVELGYNENGVDLDITSAGKGLQQVLLLLAHITSNPGSVLLLDEPDAHLEVIRQREVYSVLTRIARESGNQLIIASHSEVVMQDATDRDLLISFVGKPRRVDDRGSQIAKALKDIRADDYYQADQKGYVLYLEGSTDLSILLQIALIIDHPAAKILTNPFVCYVGNQPKKVNEHFYGLRAALPSIRSFALFDRLDRALPDGFAVRTHIWKKREIENYIASKEILMKFASEGNLGDLVSRALSLQQKDAMRYAIAEVERAFAILKKDPWNENIKISDDVLPQIFSIYYEKLEKTDRMRKTDFHILVDVMEKHEIDPEVIEVLDKIYDSCSQ